MRELEIHAGCRRIVERCRVRVASTIPVPDPIEGQARRVIRGLLSRHDEAHAFAPSAAIDILCQSVAKFGEHVAAGRIELRDGAVPISSIERYLGGPAGHLEPADEVAP